uniref:CSON001031 protein n=1 Tax=Culicoides sonorensis TaxID=179676 RepID=A0A336LQS9_CULSO
MLKFIAWSIGKIVEILPGTNGKVRVVKKIVKRLRIPNNTHAYTSSVAISCCSRTATNIVVVSACLCWCRRLYTARSHTLLLPNPDDDFAKHNPRNQQETESRAQNALRAPRSGSWR